MTVHLAWSLDGNSEAADHLRGWSTRLRNGAPAFEEMAKVMATHQQNWWKSNRSGGEWAQVKEPYRSWKRKRFPQRRILEGPDRPGHRGFQLRDQMTRKANGKFGHEVITASSLEIGSTLEYARYHQEGTRHMVARPPLAPLDARTVDRLRKILQAHIVGETMGR